ncbi:MAG: hypothetical protein FWF92_04650 [Oscillospiraceae bacterium]|nr:hypothetical protein [Oscillospiraceae bacterium]
MTNIKIIDGKFYINDIISNNKNINSLSDGKLIGIYTDVCVFFDNNIIDCDKNKKDFIKNLIEWRKSGINLITVGLQSPNPFEEYYKKVRNQDKSKKILFNSSALKSNGSLDFDYLENAEEIIKSADNLGFIVLLNILSPSCENIFEDEFAIITGIFNIIDWILNKKFSNILVNITDISHTFYKSSVLNNNRIIDILKSVKNKVENNLILGAGIKSFANLNAKKLEDYIESSDFIPVYANYTKSNHNTKKMLENIYFFNKLMRETGREVPVIMAKGDNLDEKYNSYGKNNLIESLENNISWCYYDKDGFVILPVDWDKNSSPEKKRFFDIVENMQ